MARSVRAPDTAATIVSRVAKLAILLVVAAVIFAGTSSSVLDWLSRPWRNAVDHDIPGWTAWHGRTMVFGWAICLPIAVVVARYLKRWPGQDWPRELDDKHWWHIHRVLASLGFAAALIGLWLAWSNGHVVTPLARLHALFGWATMALGTGQIASALLRGSKGGPSDPRARSGSLDGDHYSMSARRVWFEYFHKIGGHGALLFAFVTVPLGLALADAPRWMWLLIGAWWIALAAVVSWLQRRGRCIDTYQAIWGPDPSLPGNRRRPIGLGISRPDPLQDAQR